MRHLWGTVSFLGKTAGFTPVKSLVLESVQKVDLEKLVSNVASWKLPRNPFLRQNLGFCGKTAGLLWENCKDYTCKKFSFGISAKSWSRRIALNVASWKLPRNHFLCQNQGFCGKTAGFTPVKSSVLESVQKVDLEKLLKMLPSENGHVTIFLWQYYDPAPRLTQSIWNQKQSYRGKSLWWDLISPIYFRQCVYSWYVYILQNLILLTKKSYKVLPVA